MTPDGLAYLETHGGAMLPPLFARPPADTPKSAGTAYWPPPVTRPPAGASPPQLAATRPHHHAELGRRPGRPDRRAARLPSQDGLAVAAPLQPRRHRRPR